MLSIILIPFFGGLVYQSSCIMRMPKLILIKTILVFAHMESLAEDLKAFKLERDEMKSTLLDLRCRSMKNNLVFTGLREAAGEETEAKLRDFLRYELNIDYYIEFDNVHRFGSRQNNNNGTEIKPRPIVARFLYYNDLTYVLECAKRLRGSHTELSSNSRQRLKTVDGRCIR